MNYLGHVVSAIGVVDQEKNQAVLDWPVPKNLKTLRRFLGLTRYYRRFIRGYSALAAPLTTLTKKNDIQWTETAQQAFVAVKEDLTFPPVLA